MEKRLVILILLYLLFTAGNSKAESYKITVYFDTFAAVVEDSQGNTVRTCPVTLPFKNVRLPQKGYIEAVVIDPEWNPTAGVKERFRKKYNILLADRYPPGHKQNAMGKFKWTLVFTKGEGYHIGDKYARFHEEVKPERIRTRDSSACIRLLKEDGLALSYLFKKAEAVEFEFTDSVLKPL